MADISGVKTEVQRLLVEHLKLNSVKLTPSGGFSFQVDSTEVFIDVFPRGDDPAAGHLVSIYAPVGLEVPMSSELAEYVAFSGDNWYFGHLGLSRVENVDGCCHVILRHNLLADFMDPPEFESALFGVAGTAERLDDEVVQRFGGRRAHED